MGDEERLTLAAMVRAYKMIPPYEIETQLRQMNSILEFVDKLLAERLLHP